MNFEKEIDKTQVNLMNAQVKIINFFFSGHKGNTKSLKSVIGNPKYMAPSILKYFCSGGLNKEFIYDEKMDIWSLGVLFYEMFIGKFPLDDESNFQKLLSKIQIESSQFPKISSKETLSFLYSMLRCNPEKRLSASQLINHPFLTKKIIYFTHFDFKNVPKKDKQILLNNISDEKKKLFSSQNILSGKNSNNYFNNNIGMQNMNKFQINNINNNIECFLFCPNNTS